MAHRPNKLKVGVFIISGFLLFNAALIWLGASRLLRETRTYVTYFEESVQGLDVGSPVKFRGVALGRVSAIQLAPDGRLVDVEMKIDPSFRVQEGMRARLTGIGITGNAFVELGFPRPGVPTRPPPQLTFVPRAAYIPSSASFLTDVLTSLGGLLETINQMDLPALSAEYRSVAVQARELLGGGGNVEKALGGVGPALASVRRTAERARALLNDPRIDAFLDDLNEASGAVAEGGRSVRDLLQDPRLSEAIGDAREATREARELAARLSAEAASLKLAERLEDVQENLGEATREATESLGEAARKASDVLDSAGTDLKSTLARSDRTVKAAHATLGDLGRSAEAVLARLARAAALLESLAASLQREPSRLLLEGPPPEDFR